MIEKNTAGVFNAAFFPWPFDMSVLRNTLRRDGDKSVHVYIARRQYNGNHEGINVCQKRYQESRPTQTLAVILTLKTEVQTKIITLDQLNFVSLAFQQNNIHTHSEKRGFEKLKKEENNAM